MNLKPIRFLEADSVAESVTRSRKSVSREPSVIRESSTRVNPMTQAEIDGTTASRDHGLRVDEKGGR